MILHLDDILHPLRVLGKVGSGAYSVAVTFTSADPTFYFLSCIDNITIEGRKNGAIVREQYGNLNRVSVSVQADANTPVKIIGDVTEIGVSGYVITDIDVTNCENLATLMAQFSTFAHIDLTQNAHLQYLDLLYNSALEELDVTANPELAVLLLSNNSNISTLDLSANPALQVLGLNMMPNITDLDLSANTALEDLALIDCTGITSLDLTNNPLTSFNGSGSVNIDTIYVYSDNASVATGIANLITNATANDGTVYTNTAGANFSTIKTAALAKGWLIISTDGWLTETTQAAIRTAFGDADGISVIEATNDYLITLDGTDHEKAVALAGYIAEDPMLVCSLGLQPTGVTMPIRFMVSNGTAYVKTNYNFTDPNSVIDIQFLRMINNRLEWVFGVRDNTADGFHAIQCAFSPSNQSRIAFGPDSNGMATAFSSGIDITKPCRLLFGKDICTINGISQSKEAYQRLPQGNVLCIYGLFQSVPGQVVYDGLIFKGGIGHLAINAETDVLFIQKQINGDWTLIDAWGGVSTERVGTFTMEYRLPDGTPWTPGT